MDQSINCINRMITNRVGFTYTEETQENLIVPKYKRYKYSLPITYPDIINFNTSIINNADSLLDLTDNTFGRYARKILDPKAYISLVTVEEDFEKFEETDQTLFSVVVTDKIREYRNLKINGSIVLRINDFKESDFISLYNMSKNFNTVYTILPCIDLTSCFFVLKGYKGSALTEGNTVSKKFNEYISKILLPLNYEYSEPLKSQVSKLLTDMGLDHSVSLGFPFFYKPYSSETQRILNMYLPDLPVVENVEGIKHVLNELGDMYDTYNQSNDLSAFDTPVGNLSRLCTDKHYPEIAAQLSMIISEIIKTGGDAITLNSFVRIFLSLHIFPDETFELYSYPQEFAENDEIDSSGYFKEFIESKYISFPYKRFYMSPVEDLFQNLKDSKLSEIPHKEMYSFRGDFIALESASDSYDKYDIISDFFQEEVRVQCHFKDPKGGYLKSPFENFSENSDTIFKDLCKSNSTVDTYTLREYLFTKFTECTQFKPSVALHFFKKYCFGKRILDPCAGWGDRLIGAIAFGAKEYLAFDPNTNLTLGHDAMKLLTSNPDNFEVIYEPFENSNLLGREFDIVFTSPPYFDLERYSGENQSMDNYTTFNEWCNSFLAPLLNKSWDTLVPGGIMCIHLEGFEYLKFMSKVMNTKGIFGAIYLKSMRKSNNFKPIWIWEKPEKIKSVNKNNLSVIRIDESNFDKLYRLMSNNLNTNNIGDGSMWNANKVKRMISHAKIDSKETGEITLFGLMLEGKMVGMINLHPVNYSPGKIMITIITDHAYTGLGLGKYFLKQVRELYKGEIYADIDSENTNSIELFRKSGFELTDENVELVSSKTYQRFKSKSY